MSPRQLACFVGIAMIAVAIGLALRGAPTAVVGTAAAAVPAAPTLTVTPISTITVTPIELPPEAPTIVPTVVPSEEPMVASSEEPVDESLPVAPEPTLSRTKVRGSKIRLTKRHRAKPHAERQRIAAAAHAEVAAEKATEKARKQPIGRRAPIDVSDCVDTALGCLKMSSTAMSGTTLSRSKKSKKSRRP